MRNILGSRLRRAREELGLSQADLARNVKISNEHIWHLEHGKRTPSLEVLTRLAKFLKKDIGYFFKEKEEPFKLILQDETLDKKTKSYLQKFKKHCQDYLNLENLTGNRLSNAPQYQISDPEKLAVEERLRLGLGIKPIKNIFHLLEEQNLHLIKQFLGKDCQISGIYIYLPDVDEAFALVNASLSLEKQTLAAAHLYAHFLKDRREGPIIDNPDVFVNEYLDLYHPREKFAQIFASHFLLSRAYLKDIISSISKKNTPELEEILFIKNITGVEQKVLLSALKEIEALSSTQAVSLNKMNLNEISNSFFFSLEKMEKIKFKRGQIIASPRFLFLAYKAFKKKKIDLDEAERLTGVEKSKIVSFFGEK